jgi:hypothetical protein
VTTRFLDALGDELFLQVPGGVAARQRSAKPDGPPREEIRHSNEEGRFDLRATPGTWPLALMRQLRTTYFQQPGNP